MGKWLGPPHEEISRCGAKTRPGHPCGHYAMKNGRCRYHGGKSTGAKNPHSSIKHGHYTKKAIENRKAMNQFLKLARKTLGDINEEIK